MAKDLSSEFAEYLDLLLTFHMDDDETGQDQERGLPVSKIEIPTISPHVRIVTLEDGREVRITVEAM